jgi:hypothetical protein
MVGGIRPSCSVGSGATRPAAAPWCWWCAWRWRGTGYGREWKRRGAWWTRGWTSRSWGSQTVVTTQRRARGGGQVPYDFNATEGTAAGNGGSGDSNGWWRKEQMDGTPAASARGWPPGRSGYSGRPPQPEANSRSSSSDPRWRRRRRSGWVDTGPQQDTTKANQTKGKAKTGGQGGRRGGFGGGRWRQRGNGGG